MRISDWSSDVCSSDLDEGADHGHRHQRAADDDPRPVAAAFEGIGYRFVQCPGLYEPLRHDKEGDNGQDRTSVVSGQRVSVRVDFGGRRIIKKKTKHKNTK